MSDGKSLGTSMKSDQRQTDKFDDSEIEEISSRRGHGLYSFWVFVRDDGLCLSIFAASVEESREPPMLVVRGFWTFH